MIITSQIPVKGRYDLIGEKTIADAVPDRIVYRSLCVELFGGIAKKKKTTQNYHARMNEKITIFYFLKINRRGSI
jgi:hypothetical protein